jgi:hypothetical protein
MTCSGGRRASSDEPSLRLRRWRLGVVVTVVTKDIYHANSFGRHCSCKPRNMWAVWY